MNFTKERFLKYYRWLGPVYLNLGETTRERNKVLFQRTFNMPGRKNTSPANTTDWRRYLQHQAARDMISLFKKYGDNYELAWKAWQRKWPKTVARSKLFEAENQTKALNLLVSRPPMTFKRVLFEIDRAIERQRANV